ncbi:MAG: hypothetical protein ACYS6W_17880 [Planctomycetota bacterium]
MGRIAVRKTVIILVHAFVGWALCGAIMAVGMQVTSIENTLVVHAIGAPIFFAAVSLVYFGKFGYTTPLQTAIVFVSFIVFMDIFVVALLIEKSFEMFTSILGTWIPVVLIFISAYLTGSCIKRRT